MINEEIARKTLSMEIRATKLTAKQVLQLLKKIINKSKQHGGLDKLLKSNG